MSDQTTLPLGESAARGVAVIGASGYVGRHVIAQLLADRRRVATIVAVDVVPVPEGARHAGVTYATMDMRSAELSALLQTNGVDCVVHLASVVSPPRGMSRHDQYSIDVDGTHNVMESCLTADVRHVVVVSSGAAYGYHADNPVPLREGDALRGNEAFAYAHHKRLIEQSLARYRVHHPELLQLVFRPGTILGDGTHGAVTALFEGRIALGVRGSASPFCFALDRDVAACIVRGIHERRTGIFNVASDGTLTGAEIARVTGQWRVVLPAGVLRVAMTLLRMLRLTKYGPEQVLFLQHRPVLDNTALKVEFGFTPALDSRGVFTRWWGSRGGTVTSPGGNAP